MRRSMSKPLPLKAATVGLSKKDALANQALLADTVGGCAGSIDVTVLLSKDGSVINHKY